MVLEIDNVGSNRVIENIHSTKWKKYNVFTKSFRRKRSRREFYKKKNNGTPPHKRSTVFGKALNSKLAIYLTAHFTN